MANIKPRSLTASLNIALKPSDRKTFDRAAAVLGQPTSVWARAALMEEANKILSEAKAAK